jgi:hypothetical protein
MIFTKNRKEMMAFFYRNANATLDAVATNEGNEVIEEITGMYSSLESYSIYICRIFIPCPLVPKYRLISKNPGNGLEQKIRELISRHLLVYLSQIFFTQESCHKFFPPYFYTYHCIPLPALYLLYKSLFLPYLLPYN